MKNNKYKKLNKLFLLSIASILSPAIISACGTIDNSNIKNDLKENHTNNNEAKNNLRKGPPFEKRSFETISLSQQTNLKQFLSAKSQVAFPNISPNEYFLKSLKINLGVSAIDNELITTMYLHNLNYYLGNNEKLSDEDLENISMLDITFIDGTPLEYNPNFIQSNLYASQTLYVSPKLQFILQFKKNYLFQNKFQEIYIYGNFKIRINDSVIFNTNSVIEYIKENSIDSYKFGNKSVRYYIPSYFISVPKNISKDISNNFAKIIENAVDYLNNLLVVKNNNVTDEQKKYLIGSKKNLPAQNFYTNLLWSNDTADSIMNSIKSVKIFDAIYGSEKSYTVFNGFNPTPVIKVLAKMEIKLKENYYWNTSNTQTPNLEGSHIFNVAFTTYYNYNS